MPLYFLLYSQWFCSFWAGLCVEHLVKKKKIFNKLKFTVFNQILKAKQNSNQKSVSFFLHIFPLQLKKRYQIACQKKNKQFQIIFIWVSIFPAFSQHKSWHISIKFSYIIYRNSSNDSDFISIVYKFWCHDQFHHSTCSFVRSNQLSKYPF